MMQLPKDPNMLLSYVNTQLRDNYPSLDELEGSLSLQPGEIAEKLGGIGYKYSEELNKFIPA